MWLNIVVMGAGWVLAILALTGLARVRKRSRALQEEARRLRLLADMNVRVNREILLNKDLSLIHI